MVAPRVRPELSKNGILIMLPEGSEIARVDGKFLKDHGNSTLGQCTSNSLQKLFWEVAACFVPDPVLHFI